MKNKKLLYTLIAIGLCICVLVPLGMRLAWCKVTFVCKEGCKHVVWFRVGEVVDATVVQDAHQSEQDGKAMGALYYEEDCLVTYLGEPLRKASLTLYVDTWLTDDPGRIKLTVYTEYGTLIYYVRSGYDKDSTVANFGERLERAIVALGAPEGVSYVCTITNNRREGSQTALGLRNIGYYVNNIAYAPDGAAANINSFTYSSTYWEFDIVVEPRQG